MNAAIQRILQLLCCIVYLFVCLFIIKVSTLKKYLRNSKYKVIVKCKNKVKLQGNCTYQICKVCYTNILQYLYNVCRVKTAEGSSVPQIQSVTVRVTLQESINGELESVYQWHCKVLMKAHVCQCECFCVKPNGHSLQEVEVIPAVSIWTLNTLQMSNTPTPHTTQ